MVLDPGQIIASRYEIVEKIGQGGMSIVYRAKDLRLGRSVTLKVLKAEHLMDDELARKFKTEASAIACLSHPNIVNVYDVGQEGSVSYIVMEYIRGATLKRLIDRNAPFSEKEIYGVSIQVAEALAHAHKNGIIHRDIKPQNILVTKSGDIKVMDFGIARTVNSDTIAVGESTMGSVHYFSPEQAKGSVVGYQSDLYSLGIVMYEMATGNPPFDAKESVTIALMHLNNPLPDISAINKELSGSFKAIVAKLTQKRPQDRYQNADSLIADLKKMLANSGESLEYAAPAIGGTTIKFAPADMDRVKEAGMKTTEILDDDYVDLEREMEEELGYVESAPSKKQEILLVAAALATALVIIAAAMYFLLPMLLKTASGSPSTGGASSNSDSIVEVPSFIGASLEEAVEEAKALGLTINVRREEFNSAPKGSVIDQNYTEGSYVNKGASIDVITSRGAEEYEVPGLTNIDINEAYEIVADNLTIEKMYEYSSDTAIDVVLGQSIAEGTTVEKGAKITLTVSQGPERIYAVVPELRGRTEEEALDLLGDEGFVLGQISKSESYNYPRGQIMAQSIPAGRDALVGSVVSVEVSLGPPATATTAAPPPVTAAPPASANAPATAGPSHVTKNFSLRFPFPEDKETVHVALMKSVDTGYEAVLEGDYREDDLPIPLTLEGEGSVLYVLFVDGAEMGSEVIDFSQ